MILDRIEQYLQKRMTDLSTRAIVLGRDDGYAECLRWRAREAETILAEIERMKREEGQ